MSSDRYDAIKDAKAELAGESVYLSPRAVIASLNAPHGNSDMVPILRDRHPFGWSPFPVPTDGHQAPAFPSAGAMTPDGPRPTLPARADGSTDIPDLAA